MKNLLNKLEAVDVIALTILLFCFILKANGADGGVTTTIAMIVGYYFGHKRQLEIKAQINGKSTSDN